MTKFDVYADNLEKQRAERRNAAFNRYLSQSLATKTHEESVESLLQGLTVILGVGNVLTEKAVTRREKTLVI